jgi:hypothetical protein
MPTDRKPLPCLPKTCPLCNGPVCSRLCPLCIRPEVFCRCAMGAHDVGVTEYSARKTWLAAIKAKQKARKR